MGPRPDFWTATGISSNEVRHKFSLNTCNGCHGRETRTLFTHVKEGAFGTPVGLSGFLTGTTVEDPVDPSTSRTFGDLARRAVVLDRLANSACGDFTLVRGSIAQIQPLPPLGFVPTLGPH